METIDLAALMIANEMGLKLQNACGCPTCRKRDEPTLVAFAARIAAWVESKQSDELATARRELDELRELVAELQDSELAEIACAGSMAPVEDTLGRMFDSLPPNAEIRPPRDGV